MNYLAVDRRIAEATAKQQCIYWLYLISLMVKLFEQIVAKIAFFMLCGGLIGLVVRCHQPEHTVVYPKAAHILFKDSCLLTKPEAQGIWNYKAILGKDAKTGDFYSRADEHSPYGISYKSEFHPSVIHKNVKVVIEAQVRTDDLNNESGFGISITQHDSLVNWFSININRRVKAINSWTLLRDTIILPRSEVTSNHLFSFFLWNSGGHGTVDADDVSVQFIEMETPSFFPNTTIIHQVHDKGNLIFKNQFYTIYYHQSTGAISLCNKDGGELLKNLTYYFEYKTKQNSPKMLTFSASHFNLIKQTSSLIEFAVKNHLIEFTLTLTTSDYGKLSFKTQTIPKTSIYVARESLVASYTKEVQKVYTKNRKIDDALIQQEYWLDKEGFQIGQKENAVTLYHLPAISSLQLHTLKQQFAINLDYRYDHLRMVFPLLQDSSLKGIKQDVSCHFYKRGTCAETYFSMHVGEEPTFLPRLMKNPDGYLACYIFTEHADFSDLRAQRAVNYGSEDVVHFKDAIGGFAKYNIPVTKSVFYHNPDHVNNRVFNKNFHSELCNIKSMPDYLIMLQEMYRHGFDICLHTPEENTTTIPYLTEALRYFKTHFNSKTWIDHGYENSFKNNREDFVCDGFNQQSKWYAQPLFKKFGVNYFWNCYNEDSAIYSDYQFANHIKKPFIGFGDFIPLPDYTKHIINGESIISWQASSTLFPNDGSMWAYCFSDEKLRRFISDYEISINHCYPARVDSFTGFYDVTSKGKIVINNEFNKVLEKLALYRDKGDIRTTTVKDFLDYSLSLENIEYIIVNTHQIKLINHNAFDVKGLSLITEAKEVRVNHKKVTQKTSQHHTIFWFDIKAGTEANVSFQ